MSLNDLTRDEKVVLAELMQEKYRRTLTRKLYTYYPEEGSLSRHEYPKHMMFFDAGRIYRERCFMAANRVGKTEGCTGYELALHLTGHYPDWWTGRRYDRPIRAWAAGTTSETTRDIIQRKLLGPITAIGTGLIPEADIVDPKRDSGIPDAIGTVQVRHYTDGIEDGLSSLSFKAYKQGRKSFEGDEQDCIMLDEEPPADIYIECVIRTMTTGGLIMLGFTPLEGISETVLMFMPGGQISAPNVTGKFMVSATWDDAPHLSQKDKDELWSSLPPHQRDARSKGIPSIGSGAIYPVSETDILVDPFQFPDYWPRAYGFDVGWKATASVWGAVDRENDILYLYSEYKKGHSEPPVHVQAIKNRGAWIPGVGDPASRASNQRDGESLLNEYISLGLDLSLADNTVEAGLFDVYTRMVTGRLKVFKTLVQWLEEFRIYRRDEKGKVVKDNDHLMDATRYLVRSGISCARIMPVETYAIRNNIEQAEGYDPLRFGLRRQ